MRHVHAATLLSASLLLLTACSRDTNSKVSTAPRPEAIVAAPAIVPAAGSSFSDLARSALALGDIAAALPMAKHAVEAAPDDRDANSLLAEALLGSGQADEAEKIFVKLIAANGSDFAARTGRAVALLAMGQSEAAKPELTAVIAAKPPLPVLSNAALALALAGDPKAAAAALAPVAFATEGTPQLRQNYALALTLAGDRTAAYKVAEYDLGVSRSMSQVNAWYLNADKPLPEQLAAITGLRSQTGAKPMQMAAAVLPPVVATSAPTPVAVPISTAAPVIATEPAKATPAQIVKAPSVAKAPAEPLNLLPVVPSATPATKAAVVAVPDSKPVVVTSSVKPAKIAATLVALRPVSSKRPGFNASSAAPAALRGWLVQVAALSQNVSSRDLTSRLRQQFGSFFGKLGPITQSKALVGQRSVKRVFVGPYRSKAKASSVCANIKTRGGTCLVRAAAPAPTPAPAADTKI
jgi:D-alanyl-D-alanine carboxypeptidase